MRPFSNSFGLASARPTPQGLSGAPEYHYLYRSRHYKHGGAYGGSSENGTCATISTVKAFGYGTDNVDNRFKTNFYADTVFVDGKKIYLDNGKPLVYMPLELKLNLSDSPYKQTAGARVGNSRLIEPPIRTDGRLTTISSFLDMVTRC